MEIIPNWHPIFTHFTITFLVTLGGLQLYIWLKRPTAKLNELAFMRTVLVCLALVAIALTVLTGFHAYNTVAHDGPSHRAMTDHKNWALATTIIAIFATIFYLVRPNWRNTVSGILFVLSATTVGVTGFKGGELVFRHGLGVMSLPSSSSAEHDHHHGDSTAHHEDVQEEPEQQDKQDSSHNEKDSGHHDSAHSHHPSSTPEPDSKVHVHPDGKSHVH